MAKFDVVDVSNKKVSEIELSDDVFGKKPNAHLLYEAAKMQQINRRSGTVAVKNSSLVSGGGKKPWKQKGTGRARQGSTRASHWVGGGKAMGPKPRDYTYRPPRTVRRAALASAISLRASEKKLVFLADFKSDGKTGAAHKTLTKALNLKSALVVDEKKNDKLLLAVRNMEKFDVLPVEGVNVESVLRRETLVLTVAAAKALNEALTKPRGSKAKEA